MTVTQIEITKKALLDVELMEIKYLEGFPEIDFAPSSVYEDKIKKIINSEREREASFLKLSARKKLTLLIASVLIFLLTLSACVFREQIKDFIIEIYDNMTRFFSPYNESISDYQEYTFTYVPDGYKLNDSYYYENSSKLLYSNGKFDLIIRQSVASGNSTQIDTEDASYTSMQVDNYIVHITNKNNAYSVVWKNETNVFLIICDASIELSEIEKIILGAVPKN